MQNNIREFPRKGRDDDLYFDELDDYNKKIVLKHLEFKSKLHMFYEIKNHLIDQIHELKCKKKVNYIPKNAIVNEYYNKLFNNCCNNNIYNKYKCCLENVMIKQLKTKKFNYIPIYYSDEEKTDDFWLCKINKNEWILSNGELLNNLDIDLINKYIQDYYDVAKECIFLLIEYHENPNGIFTKHLNKLKKTFSIQ